MKTLLILVVALLGFSSPATALIYWSPSRYSKAVHPGAACVRRSFDVWTRKRYQSYQIKMYARNVLLPCRRGIPVAVLAGWFESFKLSGDRSEACYGKFTLRFTDYGRQLKITFTHKGTLRGMYCRDKGQTQTLLFRPKW